MDTMISGGHHMLGQPPYRSRKRTKAGRYTSDISYEELQKYFHLPTSKACVKLGVGLTILKRICRRFGLARWPYKKPCKGSNGNFSEDNNDNDVAATTSDASPYNDTYQQPTITTAAAPVRQQQQWQQPSQPHRPAYNQSYEYQSHYPPQAPPMLQDDKKQFYNPNGGVCKPVAVRTFGGQALLDSLGLSSAPVTGGADMTRHYSGGEDTAESVPDGMDMLLNAIERSASPEPQIKTYSSAVPIIASVPTPTQQYHYQQQPQPSAMDTTTNYGFQSLPSLPTVKPPSPTTMRQNSTMPTPFAAPLIQSEQVVVAPCPAATSYAAPAHVPPPQVDNNNTNNTDDAPKLSAMDQLKQLLAAKPGLAQQLAETLKQQQQQAQQTNSAPQPSSLSNTLQQQLNTASLARLSTAVSSSLNNSAGLQTLGSGGLPSSGGTMQASKVSVSVTDAHRIQELSMKLANLQQKLAMRQFAPNA